MSLGLRWIAFRGTVADIGAHQRTCSVVGSVRRCWAGRTARSEPGAWPNTSQAIPGHLAVLVSRERVPVGGSCQGYGLSDAGDVVTAGFFGLIHRYVGSGHEI